MIKRMSEVSGARYQLGDEMDPYNTKERIVTITSLTVHNLVMVRSVPLEIGFFFIISFLFLGCTNFDEPAIR